MIEETKVLSYEEIKSHTEVPASSRLKLTIQKSNGIFGTKTLRKHHLTDEEVVDLKLKANGKTINPFRRNGIYKAMVQALIDLGVNNWHSFSDYRNKIKEVMNNFSIGKKRNLWEEFANKQPRNETTGKDLTGRILQNATILQRVSGLHPYGYAIYQMCYSIHIKKENGIYFFQLCTTSSEPKINIK